MEGKGRTETGKGGKGREGRKGGKEGMEKGGRKRRGN